MKYNISKKQLINQLEKLYSDVEVEIVKHDNLVDSINFEKEEEAEQNKREAVEKYKALPDDWWKHFTETREVKSSDKLLFNESRLSTYFMWDFAEKYLKDIDKDLTIDNYPLSSYGYCDSLFSDNFALIPVDITEDLDILSVVEWDKNWRGSLRSSETRYTIKYNKTIMLLAKKDRGDLDSLGMLLDKLKNLPPYITEVTLEDNEIDLMNKLIGKENIND
uniref:Uncharacterized protein n=1 Tax=Vibrio phage P018-4 TaxID=3229728 RepID=A0AB39AJT3_9CAUD